jgi:hypothetical protein
LQFSRTSVRRLAEYNYVKTTQLLLSVSLLVPARGLTQVPPLSKADFALGGVAEGMDSATVRRRLGKPDSIFAEDNSFDSPSKLITWDYGRVTVDFFSTDHVVGLTTTDSGAATPRGLRVGQSVARLKHLYGEPSGSYEDVWDYEDPAQRLHVMRVTIRQGRVTMIYLGYILD